MSLVHNGIIENHAELRAELEAAGQEFSTETDTETVAQLVDLNLKRGMPPIEAAGAALQRLEGAYALAMIFAGHPRTDRRARSTARRWRSASARTRCSSAPTRWRWRR